MLMLYQQNYIFKAEIIGISVGDFLDSPNRLPVQWIWAHIGSILLFLDIVKKDIYEFSSCLLPHIGKKSYFWYSKVLLGGVLALGISLTVFLEKILLIFLAEILSGSINIQITVVIKSGILQCMGIYTLYCIYAFIALLKNEIVGLLVCISYVLIGLPMKNSYLYCNIFMLERGSICKGLIACMISFIVVYLVGGKLINKKDIL